MPTLAFDELQLLEKIEQLPGEARTAFAAACAQRLLLAYAKVLTEAGVGNPTALSEVLNRLWNDLAGNPMLESEVEAEIETCMNLIPEEDDGPWVAEQAAAEDAAATVAYALRCRGTGLAQEAAWGARRAYDALDDYVTTHENLDTNIPGAEEKVVAHPLMQAELARQERDLDELLLGTITIAGLQKRSKTEALEFLALK